MGGVSLKGQPDECTHSPRPNPGSLSASFGPGCRDWGTQSESSDVGEDEGIGGAGGSGELIEDDDFFCVEVLEPEKIAEVMAAAIKQVPPSPPSPCPCPLGGKGESRWRRSWSFHPRSAASSFTTSSGTRTGPWRRAPSAPPYLLW